MKFNTDVSFVFASFVVNPTGFDGATRGPRPYSCRVMKARAARSAELRSTMNNKSVKIYDTCSQYSQ